ncbi:TetR/AcrR family transcriptional regulator [Actinoallomurus spadix]|uniref:TetR/AcrR family transcriptional regulator n=1 Tax=Actinoallomurus spadix TaxID=79912 RepID=A0ABN0X9H9_9ACTN|nr:TetR/AcrR family transcriptional regulator [Actinoallomurus spadix]MCO5987930.1 TetR/AcrR family transcriptional regulator [Actinoallomurus spadix]
MTTDDRPIPSVWARPSRGRREQPALSRQQIVAEAVRLLDAEGVDALSMRKLGTRLGAGATSLYRHVANKDELVELAVDEVFGELRAPDMSDPAHWREATIACAQGIRAVILRHPWMASMLGAMAYLGPNLMRLSEDMLAMLEAAGFPLAEANGAMNTVFAYVLGMTGSEAAWLTMLARSGQSEDEWAERLKPAFEDLHRTHPRLSALFTAQADEDPGRRREEEFAYGLNRILDGVSAARTTPA